MKLMHDEDVAMKDFLKKEKRARDQKENYE
jgi:hypothetical protein